MAAEVKNFPEDSIEKKVYDLVEKYSSNIPVSNDRSRLAYSIIKYLQGEGDRPAILVKSTKIAVAGITQEELASRIETDLNNIK